MDIATRRLQVQRLASVSFASAVEAVGALGAVQSQDYGAARWALGLRTRGLTDSAVDAAFNSGAILRTHVLRPTWHFVLPQDIRWMLRLTGHRVMRSTAGRWGRLGIDADDLAVSRRMIHSVLGGGAYLTRTELGHALQRAGQSVEGQRLPHLLLAMELEGLIISGPRRGGQFTWALLDARIGGVKVAEPSDPAAELALRYFSTRGPAQVADFCWWSGLPVREARVAIQAASLDKETIGGLEYWYGDGTPGAAGGPGAHLLPNYDEYTVAYRDRSALLDPARVFDPKLFSFGSVLSNILVVGGLVRGAWRTVDRGAQRRIEVRTLGTLGSHESTAVKEAGSRMERFLQRPIEVEVFG